MAEMQKRFSKVEQIEKLNEATCLDPRIKKQAFVNNKAADDAVKRVTATAAHHHPGHSEEEEEEEGQDPAAAASAGAMFWEDFDEYWVSNNRLLPNMTTFFSNSIRQRGALAPLYPVATTRQTQVGSLTPLIRWLRLNR
ncbi:unnamed protein product [Gadus morhua 'NCC']